MFNKNVVSRSNEARFTTCALTPKRVAHVSSRKYLCTCQLLAIVHCTYRQEEYKAEGLNVAVIPFQNNEAIIDLICKKPLGLMIILEDQVNVNRAVFCCG